MRRLRRGTRRKNETRSSRKEGGREGRWGRTSRGRCEQSAPSPSCTQRCPSRCRQGCQCRTWTTATDRGTFPVSRWVVGLYGKTSEEGDDTHEIFLQSSVASAYTPHTTNVSSSLYWWTVCVNVDLPGACPLMAARSFDHSVVTKCLRMVSSLMGDSPSIGIRPDPQGVPTNVRAGLETACPPAADAYARRRAREGEAAEGRTRASMAARMGVGAERARRRKGSPGWVREASIDVANNDDRCTRSHQKASLTFLCGSARSRVRCFLSLMMILRIIRARL